MPFRPAHKPETLVIPMRSYVPHTESARLFAGLFVLPVALALLQRLFPVM